MLYIGDRPLKLLSFITLLCTFGPFGAVPSYAQEDFELNVNVSEIAGRHTTEVPSLTNPNRTLPFHYFTSPLRLDPKKFTIVILPGGPGGSSSNTYSELYGIPTSQAQYLFIDPRGTGANFNMGVESASVMSTATTAQDVLYVVQSARLTNYVIWGSSYGTVIATHIGHYFETHSEYVAPKAIVLEGTLGKALEFNDEFYEDIPMRVRDFYSHIPSRSRTLLQKYRRAQKNRKAYSASLVELFQSVAYYDPKIKYEAMNSTLEQWILNPTLAIDTNKIRPYSKLTLDEKQAYINIHITCKELSRVSSVEEQSRFKYGRLFVDAVAPCVPTLEDTNLYDVRNFKITKIPLVYLQGLEDYQTSLLSALYHFTEQNQKAKGSSFTLFFATGHSVFRNAFTPCRTNFVDDLKRADYGLSGMKECARRHRGELKEYL